MIAAATHTADLFELVIFVSLATGWVARRFYDRAVEREQEYRRVVRRRRIEPLP